MHARSFCEDDQATYCAGFVNALFFRLLVFPASTHDVDSLFDCTTTIFEVCYGDFWIVIVCSKMLPINVIEHGRAKNSIHFRFFIRETMAVKRFAIFEQL